MFNSNKKSSTQYKAKKEDLVLLRSNYQDRKFAEELDYLESLGGDTFANTLSVDYSKGISQSEIPSRKAQYGSADEDETKNFLSYIARKIAEQLEDTTLKAILILSILSILINITVKGSDISNWIEGGLTLIAAIGYTMRGAFAQSQTEREFRLHKKLSELEDTVFVWRDGWREDIRKSELVTGDIVKITPGMKVPADMLLIEADKSSDIITDESNYTGETDPVTKRLLPDCIKQRDEIIASGKRNSTNSNAIYSPMLLSGTRVLSGEGKAIVLLVDGHSIAERIKDLSQDDVSQLQMKLENAAGDFGKIGLGAAATIFLVLVVKFFIERVRTGTLSEGAQYMQLIDIFMTIAAIIIVAVPEGLPLAVTTAMAHSINTLRFNKILVKKLQDLEYLGAVNSICCSINGSTEDYETLKDAGIRLRVITGGDKTQAETMTKQLASIESRSQENACMTGNEFLGLVGGIVCKRCRTKDCDCPTNTQTAWKSRREIRVDTIANEDAFERVCNQLHVLTSFPSEAKTALVIGLKQRGDTVAVSGDGTGDVLALRKADVGLALRSSTEVVREAAGIVLLDNKLSNLVEAVFQLTVVIVVASINLVSAFTFSKPLLTPAQLLWIGFLAETQGSFVLVHEEPSRDVLKRKPYNIHGDIISGMMLKQILGQALFQFVLLMGVAYSVPDSKNLHAHQSSVVHGTFLFCQNLNLLNCRKIYGEINVFSNIPILFVITEILLSIMVLPNLFYVLDLFHVIIVICLASLTLIWPVIMKLRMRKRQVSSRVYERID